LRGTFGVINPDESRQRLIAGVRRFQREVYPRHRETYRELLREGQKPHALFVTCADSRIDPEMITQSGPGDIFVSRNVGNFVPPYVEVLGNVSAIIEYAVVALQVNHIVICGHTDCGAMIGLLHPEKLERLPVVKSWLRNGEGALSIVKNRNTAPDEHAALDQLTEENVIQQLHHLRTHPCVAGRLAQGALALSGWVFEIGHGVVRIYDESARQFLPITPAHETRSAESNR
jgi:carbonic anhydrase